MKKAFTLIELVVAIALLAMVLYSASKIFKVSIEAHRIATANAEIMQKLRAITDQLNADFRGLRKDGEIFMVWMREPGLDYDYDHDGYVRFDRIMFFADGDFQSYDQWPKGDPGAKTVRGNVARISYMLANKPPENPDDPAIRAYWQEKPSERILARTQHILTADPDPGLLPFPNPGTFGGSDQEWHDWHNRREYDRISLEAWKNIPRIINQAPLDPTEPNKPNMLSVITDILVHDEAKGVGATIDPANPDSIHMLLCEGVGEFKVQGWYAKGARWVPEVEPYEDFVLPEPELVPGVLYPYGGVSLGGAFLPWEEDAYPPTLVNEAHFNDIPGLGRALKFTFTLYDSKGIFENGRTFTHIVYIGN